jgi:hypothetical protein
VWRRASRCAAAARDVFGRLSTFATTTSATAPIGTLMRKIQRQPSNAEDRGRAREEAADHRARTLDVANTARKKPW